MEENKKNNEELREKKVEQVKQETIMDTANTKETGKRNKKEKNKTRKWLVILFLAIYALINYVQLRGSYLEYMELGQQYIDIFKTNLIYKYSIGNATRFSLK